MTKFSLYAPLYYLYLKCGGNAVNADAAIDLAAVVAATNSRSNDDCDEDAVVPCKSLRDNCAAAPTGLLLRPGPATDKCCDPPPGREGLGIGVVSEEEEDDTITGTTNGVIRGGDAPTIRIRGGGC